MSWKYMSTMTITKTKNDKPLYKISYRITSL